MNSLVELIRDSTVLQFYTVHDPSVIELITSGPQGPGGESGGTIPATTNILIGDGAGNAADSGVAVADLVLKDTGPTPGTLNEVIALLQSSGLCS